MDPRMPDHLRDSQIQPTFWTAYDTNNLIGSELQEDYENGGCHRSSTFTPVKVIWPYINNLCAQHRFSKHPTCRFLCLPSVQIRFGCTKGGKWPIICLFPGIWSMDDNLSAQISVYTWQVWLYVNIL